MAKLFGFSIDDSNDRLESKSVISPVPPNNDDGVDNFIASGIYGQYLDIEGVYRTEFDLIKRYREMALHPECDNAIEDVVNEAIVSDTNDSPITIELSNLSASDGIKDKIRKEFKPVKTIMGQRNVQISIHITRRPKLLSSVDSSTFLGPSLNK